MKNMVNNMLLCVGVVCFFAGSVVAAYGLDGVRDSSGFTNDLGWDQVNEEFFNVSFEGDVSGGTPTDNIGQLMAGNGGTFTQNGTIMNWTNTGSDQSNMFDGLVEDHYDPVNTGHTVEYRVKLNSMTQYDVSYGFRMDLFDGQYQTYLYGGWQGTGLRIYTGAGGQNVSLPQGFDFFEWHNYRITVLGANPNEGNIVKANLYVDQYLLLEEFPVYAENATAQHAMVIPPGADVDLDVDYIRLDNTGAYAPIPEPMTMCLLGLGSLFVLRRKR